tara:strand:- start:1250 stop:1612 length:363 start_codon:yes stop_codon:yes gene_type:complete
MMIINLLVLIILFIFILKFIKNRSKDIKTNNKLINFKKNLLSKESNIRKIYLRNNEKSNLDPNININIGIYDKEDQIRLKSNIHRARLAKFKKSKLNGEYIYSDSSGELYKLINGEKKFI